MQGTTLSFANLHQHGELFAKVLRTRKETRDIDGFRLLGEPTDLDYDQYDTPQSRWIAVHSALGDVMAAVRLTPTTACCGIYSYLVRDAQNGLLEDVPKDLIYGTPPVSENIWEVTRGYIRPGLVDVLRDEVELELARQIRATARAEGISYFLALLPVQWGTWADRCAFETTDAGPQRGLYGQACRCFWIDTQGELH